MYIAIERWSPLGLYCHNVFFFFFQAEDGIRDKLVTGVQTCALPILLQVSDNEEIKEGSSWSGAKRSQTYRPGTHRGDSSVPKKYQFAPTSTNCGEPSVPKKYQVFRTDKEAG